MVAEWPFCPDCFQALLAKKEKDAPVETEPERGASVEEPAPEPAPTVGICDLCQRETERELLRRVGIWMFCPACYADLAARSSADASEEEEGAETDEPGDAEVEEEDPGLVARVRVGFVHFVNCAGCGRRIPEGGSRSVEGKPLCPECYRTLNPEPAEAGSSDAEEADRTLSADVPPGEGEASVGGDRCQSCGRSCGPGALVEVEGFQICRACAGTDREMAVRLARARHQKMMRKLEEDLTKE